ncbi:class I SAM-dependent methyltransferase [Methylomonas sp. HYX-M1]|uniref:class I SAM-dependent methyltransferase n=1 Tax=Methylomonas sp. HYX-M1 TaxID=3139307 RepID=UPI00345C0FAA
MNTVTTSHDVAAQACQCNLCQSERITVLYELDDFAIVRCQECGLVFLNMALNADKLSDMYSDNYYKERSDYFQVDVDPDRVVSGEAVDFTNFKNGLALLERFRPEKGRLLDVGCALGGFLGLAKQAGWTVTGVDISHYAAEYCRERLGVEAHSGLLTDIAFADETFDVVTLWDVVEHFEKPVEQLKEVNRILKTGGWLLVDTPNERSLIRSVARLIYDISGGRVDGPLKKLFHQFHLYYFNENTLRRALSDSGFELVSLQGRPLPADKGRAGLIGRCIVTLFSWPEKWLGREFELVALARKR